MSTLSNRARIIPRRHRQAFALLSRTDREDLVAGPVENANGLDLRIARLRTAREGKHLQRPLLRLFQGFGANHDPSDHAAARLFRSDGLDAVNLNHVCQNSPNSVSIIAPRCAGASRTA